MIANNDVDPDVDIVDGDSDGDGARDSDGDGAGHKNACLNENVTLAHLPQQERLFCLLPSSLGLRPRLSGRRQKSRSCFG